MLVELLSGFASPELATHIDGHVDCCSACQQLMLNLARAISTSATSGGHSRSAVAQRVRPHPSGNVSSVSHRYRILGLLGAGGMGRVYRALDRLSGAEVALKQVLVLPSPNGSEGVASAYSPGLSPSIARQLPWADPGRTAVVSCSCEEDPSAALAGLSVLAEEFRTLAALRHPNVISVLDYGFDAAGQPFYTMELLHDALPLLEFAKDRSTLQQIELLLQVLQATAYLHRRGVVHRDLTPSNVLVVPGPQGPQVKVVDFGLAITTDCRRESSVAGTLLYMAPELLRSEAASEASDLYAIGAMAYQMLAGRYPFATNGGVARLVRQILVEEADLSPLLPALRPVIGRALHKNPACRQVDAASLLRELAAAADIPLTSEPVAARDSYLTAARFVGREQQLGLLRTALDAAQRGRGSAWLLSGESGVGKSRLMEELRSTALIAGVLTARGQAMPDGAAYDLWRPVLKLLALQVPLSALEASVLATVSPGLPVLFERELPELPQLPGLDAPSAKLRLLRVVDDIMERLPSTSLILLEDLQWADSASLELLAQLTSRRWPSGLMVVATCRTEEAPALPESLPQLRKLELPRLTRREVEQLCEAMLGPAGQDHTLVDLIARETEGNAFFVVEVMRALAAECGTLDHIGRSGLPQQVFAGGIEQVLERRLSRVPARLRLLLHLAAVAGRLIDLPLLTWLMPQAESQIRELADLGILELHLAHWRFCHDKLRDRVSAAIGASECQGLHGRIAAGLESLYSGDTSRAAQTALHYRQAGQLAAAARCYRLAGDDALRRGAPGEAEAMFEQARLLHPRCGAARIEQVQVFRGLTEAKFGLGRHGEAEAALRTLCTLAGTPLPVDALGLWMRIGRLTASLLASRMGLFRHPPPAGTEERAVLSELLLALGLEELFVWTDQAELGLLCALWELYLEDQLATEPRRTYHSSGLYFILSHTPLRGLCRRHLAQFEGRVASGSHTEINYRRVRALVEINNNNFHSALLHATQAVTLARHYRDDLALLHSLLQLQLAAAGLDDFPQMLTVGREMESLAIRADNPRYLALAYICQGAAQLSLGDFADAAALLDRARACLPQNLGSIPESLTLALAASCARHQLQFERADDLADQALHAVLRTRWTLAQLRHPLVCILDVYLGRERAEYPTAKIEAALARLHQTARQFGHVAPANELFHGLYFWRYQQPHRALRLLRRSITLAEKHRLGLEKAQAQYWLGCFAQSTAGRSLVHEGAELHLRAALETFERLGSVTNQVPARAALQYTP